MKAKTDPTRPPAEFPLDASLRTYRRIFRQLPPITSEAFQGDYEGLVVGPPLFQRFFRRLMKQGGLPGWKGKEFHDGQGINVLERNGEVRKRARMYVTGTVNSIIDGRPTLALGYRKYPLAVIRDEIRAYDERTVLGMTYVNWGPFRKLAMPFALRRRTS